MAAKNFSVRFKENNMERMEQRLDRLRVKRSLYLEVCHSIIDNYYNDEQLETEIRLFEMENKK